MTRLAALLFAGMALSACQIWAQPEDQAATTAVAPPPVASTRAPAPAPVPAPAPAGQNQSAQGVAIATPPPRRGNGDEEVIVRGTEERQVPPPNGDPRSVAQRMEDIRAWDSCVMRAQNVQADPTRPNLDSPEEICRRALGMARRTAVPDARRP